MSEEQIIEDVAQAASPYTGVLGPLNWATDTFAPWLALLLIIVLAGGYYYESRNQPSVEQPGAAGGPKESSRKRKKVSARGMVQGFSEEERLGKITSGKTPRSR